MSRNGPAHARIAIGRRNSAHTTRLWFVIFFIPIFPLGRKRIIDYCPACTRHYAVDAQKWETAKQLEISGAQDEYRASPTPENAIAFHQQLLKYHQAAEAAEFQKKMSEQFASSAKVQAYLGAALEHFGKRDEAVPYFTKALELRPDLPEARIGMARSHMRARIAWMRRAPCWIIWKNQAQPISIPFNRSRRWRLLIKKRIATPKRWNCSAGYKPNCPTSRRSKDSAR